MAATGSSLRRGRPREWSPERVHEELRAFVNGTGEMPAKRDLMRAGRDDLRYAITRYGGMRYWADVLGLSLRARQLGPVSADNARREAEALIARLGYLPGANKLRQLGYRELARVVLAAGGSRAYCQQLGLPHVDGRSSAVRRRG